MKSRSLAFLRPGAPVLVVHGTFAACDEAAAKQGWWNGRSRFSDLLATYASARGEKIWVSGFAWSGENSEAARRTAARELAVRIAELEDDTGVTRYHIVAHSHGGNVTRRALRLLGKPPRKIGRVIYLGTPFLHFDDTGVIRRTLRRIPWPLLLIFFASATLLQYLGPQDFMLQLLFALFASGVATGLASYWAASREIPLQAEQHLLQFSGDEAIHLLARAGRSAAEPERLLAEILGGTGPALGRRWIPRLPVLGFVIEVTAVVAMIMLFGPYRPSVKPFFTSRLPDFRRTFMHLFRDSLVPPTADAENLDRIADLSARPGSSGTMTSRFAAPVVYQPSRFTRAVTGFSEMLDDWSRLPYLLAALSYYLVLPLDYLLGSIAWLGDVLKRLVLWYGIRVAATAVFGIDILGARFRIERAGEVPKDVVRHDLGDEIENRQAVQVHTRLGQTLARTPGALQTDTMVAELKEILADADLLHGQYYQDEEVIKAIADLLTTGSRASAAAV